MKQGLILASCVLGALAVAGCATAPRTEIRALGASLAPDGRPVSHRVAEAQAHFRLGNVALAAEGFRKALREDPQSVDAMNGLAACYDRFGRFDLSHSYYQRALALAPDDHRLYANLTTSFALQGRTEEADKIRRELAARMAARSAPSTEVDATAAAEPAAKVVPATPPPSKIVEKPSPAITPLAERPLGPGPRLERMSLAEVVLVTTAKARSLFAEVVAPKAKATPALPTKADGAPRAKVAGSTKPAPRAKSAASAKPTPRARTATATAAAKPLRVTVLNAARVPLAAASTRQRLNKLGWSRVAVGNVDQVRARSVVAFSPPQRAEAQRLARSLGIAAQQSRTVPAGLLLVIVGRDSASPLPNA